MSEETEARNTEYKEALARTPMTFKRAFGIILPLCLVALLLAGAVISVANDVYAFVKPDAQITVNVSAPSVKELSSVLQDAGVIKNAFIFEIYLRRRGLEDELALLDGDLTLNSSMSYRELITEIF